MSSHQGPKPLVPNNSGEQDHGRSSPEPSVEGAAEKMDRRSCCRWRKDNSWRINRQARRASTLVERAHYSTNLAAGTERNGRRRTWEQTGVQRNCMGKPRRSSAASAPLAGRRAVLTDGLFAALARGTSTVATFSVSSSSCSELPTRSPPPRPRAAARPNWWCNAASAGAGACARAGLARRRWPGAGCLGRVGG